MKKLLSIIVFALFSFTATAQVSKTVNVSTASTLSTLLTSTELSTVTDLTVTGNIDARDVKTMRDNMPLLAVLDIGAVNIKEFAGRATYPYGSTTYPANEMPKWSFFDNSDGGIGSKTSLKTIILPTSITSIGESAFFGCKGLTGSFLTLPNSVTSIGVYAFAECIGFTGSLTIPSSVTTIGSSAFYGCSGFTGSLTIPNSVITIGSFAFWCCSGFTGSLTVPNSVTSIGNYAFYQCYGITGSLTIPNSVTSIGDEAFRMCNFSGNLTLGSGLTTIGSQAFFQCGNFKFIYSLSTTPPIISDVNYFLKGYIPAIVFVPTSSVAAYKAASGWSGFTIAAEKHVNINVSTAGGLAAAIIDGGFGSLNSITHLTVTGNINSIDFSQMKTNMTSLTAIDLSGAYLASNALPSNAFQGRTSLTSVIIPSTLLSIGEYAFDGCINLTEDIPLPSTVISIGDYAFRNCSSLTGTLNIPAGVTVINNYTFSGCGGITGSLTIPESVTSIGSYAFNGCKGLTGSINLDNSITSLGANAFQNCTGFTGSLTLSNTLTTISNYAFAGCSQISGKVDVPLSATSIGSYAFQDCAKITELSVGKNLTSIGDNALNGCKSLAKISVPRTTPPTVYANTFTGITVESCTINVPTGASITYQTANYWSMFSHYTESLSSDNYTATISIGTGGSVKENNVTLGNGSVITVAVGSTKTFTFIPNAGYAVAKVTYRGVVVTSHLLNNQYTTPAINANVILEVTFIKTQYLLSIKSADSGTVELLCEYGATPSFHFTASSGWKVNTLLYNGVDITNSLTNGVYKVPAVSADALLTVSFEQTNALVSTYSNVKVYTNSSEIIIEGSSEGEIISLFSINGKQIKSQKSQGERIVIPAQKDVIYFVKTESKTFKVIL